MKERPTPQHSARWRAEVIMKVRCGLMSPPVSSAIRTLEEMERNQIRKILSETRWRIEGKNGAAAIFGLHPGTLRARMHKFGILRPEVKEPD